MSEPRLIYPLLDGFLMGDALSEHDGLRCYPAIRQKTGEKYLVKVISIPASRMQLDALLLAGAFSDKDAASAYFKELAQDVAAEAKLLQQLQSQEGFLSFEGCQVVSAAEGPGYEVYLLSPYRQSLLSRMEAAPLTQRELMDIALDLCAALAACRRAGYLYVDLKPGNIFLTEDTGCRIGDLGLVPLSSLQFAQLRSNYRSRYTAPEMAEDFAVINTTADVYALGMVLYQACNGGALPEEGEISAPPMFADYELAEILLGAISADPRQRFADPTQFAQAIIAYMQRNEVTDAPLCAIEPESVPEEAEDPDFLPALTEEELSREIETLPENEVILMEAMAGETDDIHEMMDHADELLAAEVPEIVVAPESAEMPIPEPEPESEPEPEPEPEPAPKKTTAPAMPDAVDCPIEKRPFPWRVIITLAILALLVLAAFLGWRYYENVYIQHIDALTVTQTDNTATITVVTDTDETLLQAVCTDSYGNVRYENIVDGTATFTDLNPQTRYTIRLLISGNHKLTGMTSDSFTTPEQTKILTFTAGIGPEDASVLLTLTSTGPAVESWTVTATAHGCEAVTTQFTGNNVTVYDLVAGKEYTFTLSAAGQTLGGCTQVNYTASNIILAQNAAITACGNGQLTVSWENPEGFIPKDGWALRCYNSAGYDQTVVTYESWYTFEGLNHSVPCTVEITAVGMTQNVSVSIGANPITVERFEYSVAENSLTVRFLCGDAAPEGGWIVHCTVDGISSTLQLSEPTFTLDALPGSVYTFLLEAANGAYIFGAESSYTISEVGSFTGYGVQAGTLTAVLELPQLTLTAPAETVIEASEDAITVLYILRTADGALVQTLTEELTWSSLWAENTCTLTVPTVPAQPGSYRLSVYFAGGLAAELEFTVE